MTINPKIYTESQHKIRPNMIDSDALLVLDELYDAGFTAHLVGGGVRDLLLDKTPKDFDIVTDATPREARRIFRKSRIIGRRFLLLHVYFYPGPKIIEVSTFRAEGQTPSQIETFSPEDEELEEITTLPNDNVWGSEETDALRRDISINALFYNPHDRTIIDYVNGMEDLRDGIVRVIGDPKVRFLEDPVRILRVIRHSQRANFVIEPNLEEEIKASSDLLNNCPAVRIYDELKKDLKSGYCLKILSKLIELHTIDHLIPKLKEHGIDRNSPLYNSLELLDTCVLSGVDLPHTITLALIMIFTTARSKETPVYEIFSNADEIREEFSKSFPLLPISRKEREEVEGLIATFITLANLDESPRAKKENLQPIMRFAPLVLNGLMRVLPVSDRDSKIIRLLKILERGESPYKVQSKSSTFNKNRPEKPLRFKRDRNTHVVLR